MVAVQVTDENMVDTAGLDIKTQHLLLRAFSAIDQIEMLVYIKRLRGWIPVENWRCRTTSQYRYLKFHIGKTVKMLLCFLLQLFFHFFHKNEVDGFFSGRNDRKYAI